MYRSSHPLNGFDALAPLYDHLARWVFGGAILRAQRSQLQTLEESKNLLFIGGGSGEVLAELLRSSPELKVTYIDASSAMIARAQARLSPPELQRVTWVHATHEILLEPSHTQQRYDGVLTYFFLDCLRPDELLTLIDALEPRIRRWSLVDFVPQTRWWARHLITFMYLCSALTTDLPNRRLSPVPDWLKERGWRATRESSFARGLISAATFERPPD
jgi:SAM-dependent methyltransferase